MSLRSVLTIVFAGWLAVLGAPQLWAQFGPQLKADIPFEFHAGNAMLPAGPYTLGQEGNIQHVLSLRSGEGKAAAFLLTISAEAGQVQNQSRLVFRKYGDRYFLSQVWVSGQRLGWEVPVSRSERELAKRAARHEVVAVLAQR